MATYDLRPLHVGEILDRTFGLYRAHFATLVGIAAVCQGPAAVMSLYVVFGGGLYQHPLIWVVAALVSFFGYLLAAGATLRVISEAYLGHEPELGSALGYAARRMWPLFIAGATSGLAIGLATLLLLVPGIIVACGYCVVSQVVVLEKPKRANDALGRSWELTKGSRDKAFAIGLVVYLVTNVPAIAIIWLARSSPDLANVVGQLATLVLRPIMACAFTLFYYDLRVRKEAFDLELLGQHLGLEATPS